MVKHLSLNPLTFKGELFFQKKFIGSTPVDCYQLKAGMT